MIFHKRAFALSILLSCAAFSAPAKAGTALYDASFSIHAFGNDDFGYFASMPIGAAAAGSGTISVTATGSERSVLADLPPDHLLLDLRDVRQRSRRVFRRRRPSGRQGDSQPQGQWESCGLLVHPRGRERIRGHTRTSRQAGCVCAVPDQDQRPFCAASGDLHGLFELGHDPGARTQPNGFTESLRKYRYVPQDGQRERSLLEPRHDLREVRIRHALDDGYRDGRRD